MPWNSFPSKGLLGFSLSRRLRRAGGRPSGYEISGLTDFLAKEHHQSDNRRESRNRECIRDRLGHDGTLVWLPIAEIFNEWERGRRGSSGDASKQDEKSAHELISV